MVCNIMAILDQLLSNQSTLRAENARACTESLEERLFRTKEKESQGEAYAAGIFPVLYLVGTVDGGQTASTERVWIQPRAPV